MTTPLPAIPILLANFGLVLTMWRLRIRLELQMRVPLQVCLPLCVQESSVTCSYTPQQTNAAISYLMK